MPDILWGILEGTVTGRLLSPKGSSPPLAFIACFSDSPARATHTTMVKGCGAGVGSQTATFGRGGG